jgi:UPF0755 protein
MARRSSSLLAALFLPIIALFLLAILIVPALLIGIPNQAEAKFGPATPALGPVARYRLAVQLILQESSLTTPLNSTGEEIPFRVASGESTNSIIQRLARDGLIQNPGAFRAYLQYAGLDTNIQAGDYRLSPLMTAIEIATRIQDATPTEITFVILPGWRSEEIAAALPTSGLQISEKAFNSAIRVHSADIPLLTEIPDEATVEGFLFPGSYVLPRQTTAPELIQYFLNRFDTEVSSEIRQAILNQGLSLYEGITLASIVEREAVVENEMPLIASVFLNRLTAGMALAADPTVQYALGFNEVQQTWWTNPLSLEDLKVDSLYNTYIYPGLPPGPIANPSLRALRATAFPAQTPYFYFRSLCDGSGRHAFAVTFEEHTRNACP